MLRLILASALIVSAFAGLGVNFGNTLTLERRTADCFIQNNLTQISLEILNENLKPNTYFLGNYITALDAGIDFVDAYVTVSDSFSAEEICEALELSTPASYDQVMWLKVSSQRGLWSQDISERIPFLETIASTCSKINVNVGIFSNAVEWSVVMGSQLAGSDTLRKLPVYYANPNGVANFNDFRYAGFGGWKSPVLKDYTTTLYNCQYYLPSTYYEDL